jgi:DNA-binding response OmpR family regulator
MYILVVDDDPFANTLVKFVLNKEGYEVETADNPRGAMQIIERREPDLLLLDVKMPYQNGFEFSSKLRAEGYETPLIFMTAQDTVESKLQGFRMGADDYICKPYNHEELVARVHALMRRVKQNSKIGMSSIRVGRVELFPADLKVVIDDNISHVLTHTETMVLRALMSRAGQSVSRNQILTEVWDDEENNSNIVDVYIRRLRAKLEPNSYKPRYIISMRGVGYKFIGK